MYKITRLHFILLAIMLIHMLGIRATEPLTLPDPLQQLQKDPAFVGSTITRLDKFTSYMNQIDALPVMFYFANGNNISADGQKIIVTFCSRDGDSHMPEITDTIFDMRDGRGWQYYWPGLGDWYLPPKELVKVVKVKVIENDFCSYNYDVGISVWDPLDPQSFYAFGIEEKGMVYRVRYDGQQAHRVSLSNEYTTIEGTLNHGQELLYRIGYGDGAYYLVSRSNPRERTLTNEWQNMNYSADSKSPNERYLSGLRYDWRSQVIYDRSLVIYDRVEKRESILLNTKQQDIKRYCWLPDSHGLIVDLESNDDEQQSNALWYIGINGKTRDISDKVELCGASVNYTYLLLRCEKTYYLVSLQQPLATRK